MTSFFTNGTCSRQIIFNVTDDNKVEGVKFIGGCLGNQQGVSKLVEGRDIDEVIGLLYGIRCRNNTSCPDQLAKALMNYKETQQNK